MLEETRDEAILFILEWIAAGAHSEVHAENSELRQLIRRIRHQRERTEEQG